MFSNRYIFIYSAILVIISAMILSVTAIVLRPFQEANVRIEKIQNLLKAVHITSSPKDAESLYQTYFIEELAISADGTIVGRYKDGVLEGVVRPFDLDLKSELYAYKESLNGRTDLHPKLPLYICETDGKRTFVIPILGAGLWGPVWGNIALSEDLSEITGVNFDHKGETPGLGAEISGKPFQQQFEGKSIFDANGDFHPVRVVKRADKNSLHEVDGVSGGTITSEGVSNMIQNCLKFYEPYFKQLKTTSNE